MARFFISRGAAAMYRRAAVIPSRPPTAEEEGLRQSDSRRVRAPHGGAGRSGPPALASGPIDRRLTPPLMSLKSLRKERRPETPVHSWRLRPLRRTYSCKRPHNRDQGDPVPRRCVVDVGLQRLRKKRGRTGKGDGAGSSGQLRRKWATRALTPTQGTHGGASRGRPAYVEQPRVSRAARATHHATRAILAVSAGPLRGRDPASSPSRSCTAGLFRPPVNVRECVVADRRRPLCCSDPGQHVRGGQARGWDAARRAAQTGG